MPDWTRRREIILSLFRYHPVILHVMSEDGSSVESVGLHPPFDELQHDDAALRHPSGRLLPWDRIVRVDERPESDLDDPAMIAFLPEGLPPTERQFLSDATDRGPDVRRVLRLVMLSNPNQMADGLNEAVLQLNDADRTALAEGVSAALSSPDFSVFNLAIALALCGGPAQTLALGDYLLKPDLTWPGPWFALSALRMAGTRDSYMQIQRACHQSSDPRVLHAAKEMFLRVAGDKKVTHWEVEDQLVPNCGLNEGGDPTISWNDQRLHMQLDDELRPFLRSEDGRRHFDLVGFEPSPGIDAAKRRWDVVREQVAEAVPVQVRRLEEACVQQHRWGVAQWKQAILGHPLMIHLAQRAIWGTYSRSGRKLRETFRVAPDHTLWGPDDEPWELDHEHGVGLVHPLELDDSTRACWEELLVDYEIATLFPQIDRSTHRPSRDNGREHRVSLDVEAPSVALIELFRRGWKVDGHSKSATKVFRNGNVKAAVAFEKGENDLVHFSGLSFSRFSGYARGQLELRDVPPIPYSEAVYQFENLRMPQQTGGWAAVLDPSSG